ncbi:MAG: hypothetical protein QOD70_2253 [Frankiales bacterium]|jgi:hypothetical protein|nr:hypothetical protein [Frankiales bacterium]
MTAAKKDLRADLQADLLSDLAGPIEDTPAPPPAEPVAVPPELTDATPALSLQWTPLRWSRPKVTTVRGGLGKTVTLGPLKVELSVKE